MAHLHRFPLDYLKIDRSFVTNIENTADALEIVRTIKTLADQLGLRVIAEGIENSKQLDLIRSLSCEYGQGFLFSKAVRPDQAERLLLHGLASREGLNLPSEPSEESEATISSPRETFSTLGIPDPTQGSGRKQVFSARRKWIPLGLTVVILLFVGVLLASLNRLASPPSTPVVADRPGKAVASPKIAEILPVPATQETPVAVPKAARVKSRETVHTYPVKHDHWLGSCRGIMRIAPNGISFISENNKHSFDFKYSQCFYALDSDQLTIKAESKVYRFTSAIAFTKEENRSHLLDIFEKISKHDLGPSSKKR
jgi:hypothetical protein